MMRYISVAVLLLSACREATQQTAARDEPAAVATSTGPASAPPAQDMTLLRSDAVKDAIHRALTTGKAQRWQDGDLSGYAVPSLDALPNGCRTVRYTVDQRPDGPFQSINACEGSKR